MKKPTILKFGLLSLIFLQSIISYSQNLVSYVEKTNQAIKTEKFLVGSFPLNEQFGGSTNDGTNKASSTVAALENPVIPYAQLPYAGQVAECPNDGKLLPKLFLCGGNDSRPIDIKITDARSIIWERFISGGSCVTVSNSDCANDNASDACWVKVGDERVYIANTAGQFRIKIIDNAGNPYTFYFNVYQNTLIPTAITKSDIIKNSTGTCKVDGKIKVGGFGDGYEYSFTTTGSPGTWDVNNTFTTSTPGNYTAFIRIKGVVGSCEFKVLNQDIKSVTLAVSTEVVAPRCFNGKGSIKVIKNDNSKAYTFNIYKPANSTTRLAFYDVEADKELEYTFKDLDPGTYRVETVLQETKCVIDNKTSVVIPNAPAELTSNPVITKTLTPCRPGTITVGTGGGTYPFRYLVSINGAPFFQNANNVITTVLSGSYLIRIEDANGCSVEKTIPVKDIDKPTYTVTKTDGDCTNPNGKITINVTDSKGYTIETRIRGENSFTTTSYITMSLTGTIGNTVYNNVSPENYIISVKYTKSGNTCTDPDFPIAIGLTTALTASVGVAELSGCGPVGNVKQGKVRITNAEGGVPLTGPDGPYLYSYDDRKTWVTDKEMYVDPGTHIFYIKDQKCEIPLKAITLLDQPKPPTISVDDPVFNCDGSATTTVTVTNSGSPTTQFTYDYFIDGVLNTNTPTNIFKNVTQGDHTISVSYNVLNVPTESVLLNESFGSGPDVSSPGMNPNFCWERQVEATKCNNDKMFGNGEYTVTSSLKNSPYPQGWRYPVDHTSGSSSGRFLAVDAGNAIPNNAVLYRKTINDIIPNVPIKVTFVATNLLKKGNTQPDASLTVELQNGSGVALSSQSTGKIPKTNDWVDYTRIIDPGNNTTLDFVLRLELSQVDGIDFAVDDLVVTQMPKACNTVANFPIFVDGSKAFSAGITGYKDVRCSGDQNGEITLSAKNFDAGKGFQYLVTGDPAGWQTVIPVPAATSGSITLKNLASKIYNISIRYDDKAGSCVFPTAQEIKSPKKLKVDAWVDQVLKCSGGANIKAKASDGTPGYLYELRETDGVTVVRVFQESDVFLDIKKIGNYKVIAKDLNECETEVLASVDIVAPVKPKLENVSSSVCFDKTTGANITIKVTEGVADYTYTVAYNGGTPVGPSATFAGPNFTYNALNEGSYEFVVKDSYGCESDPITQVISGQLMTETLVSTPLDCDPVPNNSAVLTGTITGGKAPFEVTITTGDKSGTLVPPTTTGNTFTYTTAVAGDYTFTIKDANNCTTTSNAKINALVAVTGSVVKATDPSCHDGVTGQVQLSGGGGTGKGYEFSFNGNDFSPTSLYTALNANTTTANTTVYKYQVKDSNGCLSPIYDVTLNNPTLVVASADFPANTACNDAVTITVTGNGGAGGYTYSFNGSTTYTDVRTLTVNLTTAVQTIKYSVQDSKGCTSNKTIDVPAYNPPTGITFSTPAAITCMPGKTTTSVTLTPKAGGVAPFTYLITVGTGTGTSNNDGIFSGLTAGNYTFQITDANGCSKTASIEIDPAVSISVSGKKTDVKCVGATNGTATFTITGASAVDNFTYVLTPDSGTVTQLNDVVKVTGLAVGTYKLQVKDKTTGCLSNVASVTIDPATAITITGVTASNVNCNNSISNIVVTATGGVPNYKYAYVIAGTGMPDATAFSDTNTTINTGTTQSNLFWDVYVMDQNDCTAGPFNKEIFRDASPSLKAPAPAPFCFTAPSTTSVDASTFFNLGTGTHTYTVNGTAIGGGGTNFNITASGSYKIIAKDANGCTSTAIYDIKPQLSIVATRVKDLTCDANAEISFVANGGTTTYSTYEVQFNGTGSWASVTSPYNTANAGDYQFRVTDDAGCKALSNTITITAKTTPSFAHNEKQPTCIGAADGVINIINPTGLAPFSYLIKIGTTTVSTTASTINLKEGVYDVLLTDSKGCTFSDQITLSDPGALNATVNTTPLGCNADNTTKKATIAITSPSGGSGTGYEYSFNGGTFSPTASYSTDIAGTAITIVMRDSNKCTQSLTGPTFTTLNGPTITGFTASLITCNTNEDTSNVDVLVSNGTGTLTYTIVSGPTTNTTGATDGKFTGLADGAYFFKVTDANGCSDTKPYTVKPLVNIAASLLSQVNVKCNGSSTGSAKITVSAYAGTYTATLTPATGTVTISGSTVDVTGLVKGLYTLRITDEKTNCIKDVEFTITESTLLTLVEASNKNANCAQALSKVSVTAGGGKSPYSYAFRSAAGKPGAGDYVLNKNTADLDPAITTWYAWVKDANDCETPVTITIAKDPDAVINLPAQQCLAAPFDITLSGSGKGLLKYTVNGVGITGTTYKITASGTYKLGVKDANGCTDFKDYIVDKQIYAEAVAGKDLTCSTPMAATITVNIINGTSPFSYQIYDGTTPVGSEVTGIAANSFTENFTTSGNYNFEVKDSKGCPVRTNGILVTATGTVVANPSLVDTNCYDSADGSVTFNPTGGKAPYKISFEGSPLDFVNSYGGLKAGTYNYIIEDARGCRDVNTITINQPVAITAKFKKHDIKCNSNVPGAVEIESVTDGVGPFVYTLYDKTNTAIHTSVPTNTRSYMFPNALTFGDYYVTIVDSKGCELKGDKLKILTEPRLKFLPVVITGTCSAGATVDLFLDPLFPSAPDYIYSIVGDASSVSAPTSDDHYKFIKLNFGQTYYFQVQDANACVSVLEVEIPKLSLIDFSAVTTTNVSCNATPSVPNGRIDFTVSGYDSGVKQIRFEVVDQFSNASFVPPIFKILSVTSPDPVSYSFTNLPVGSYTLIAKEMDGTECSNSMTFEITQPIQPLSVSVVSQTKDNCNKDALVTVKGTGGSGDYEYTFVADGALEPTTGYSTTNPISINYELGKDWDIWVKDKNGCTAKVDVTIGKDLPPAIVAGPAVPCFTGTSFTVDLSQYFTSTVGTPTYTLDGVDLLSAIATITSAKSYTIGIRDGNGCPATQSYLVRDILTLVPKSFKELDCKTAAPNASVTVEAKGGDNTSYAYTITAGTTINTTGATTGIFTGLAAGDYTFEVSDGVCTATTEITIDDLVPIVPAKLEINPLCIGANGSVEISATGGVGPYTYQKAVPPTLITETINKFTQTALEGIVTYYVRDSKGCVEEIKATVVDPPVITINSVVINQLTCGSGNNPNEATITVNASGGTGTLQYSFDDGDNFSENPVFTTTVSGIYNIIVKDANDCETAMRPENVLELDPPVITGFNKTQMTCPGLASDVTINHSKGIGTLSFKIVSGPTINTSGDASGIYTGLSAGDYVFRITDSNNCTAEDTFTVPGLPTLELEPQVVTNVGCITDKTGSATFTASNLFAAGAFSYTVVTVPASLTFTDVKVGNVVTLTNLAKGQYDVTIKDNTTLCEVTESVTITEPAVALSIDAVASNVNCNDGLSQITMTPAGGTPDYKYSIVESGTGEGTYTGATSIDTATLTNGVVTANGLGMTWSVDVYIKDANDCTAMKTITITKDDTPTVTTPALAADQCTANGSYTFTATGTGVAPLRFSIDDVNYFESTGTTYTFTVPAPTTASKGYTVYIKDGNGCPAISATSTTVYKPLTFSVVQDKDITCVPMPTTTDAQFTLTAADGKPGYTYEVDFNGNGFNTITSPYRTSVTGKYVFRVTDTNSCSVLSDEIIINAPVNPSFATTKVDVKCTGDSTGTITVTPSGGVGPYTFALSGVGSNTTGDATGLYTALPKGSYTVVVTDHYGCTSAALPAIDINEPTKLSVTPTISKNTSCSASTLITLEGHDGTPGYRYSFDNGDTYDKEDHMTVDLNGPVQTIWYSVIDANGCKTPPVRIDINPLNKPNKLDFNATVVTCKTGEDVSTVDVKATNGVGPLVFEIISTNTTTAPALFGPITTPDSATAASFPGLLPGTYTFKVTDDNKCSYQDSFTIASKINILADGQLVAGVACKGEANGKVTFTVSKIGTLGFTYVIDSGAGVVTQVGTDTFELTNLPKGTYKIDVKDIATDCVSSFSVDVPEPETLKVDYVTNKHANCDNGAEITATATFGTAGYKYAFVKAGDPKVYTDSDTAILDKAFTWVIWAKDAHDCEISAPITIIVDSMPSITSAIPTQCPSTAGTYDIPVIAAGFTANLEYSLDGNSWGTNNVLVVKTTGDHTVYVRDENKCVVSQVVTILEPLKLLYDITEKPTCNGSQGEVTLIPSGGTITPSYEYSKDNWVNTQATPVFSGLTPGTYTFSVRDTGTNCTKDVEVVFETPNTAIDFSLTPAKVLCNGGSTGSITVKMADQTATVNNNPVYTYAINPSPLGMVLVGNVFTNLPKGTYTVTVTSGKGCPVDQTIDVEEPLAITVPNPNVLEFGCTTINKENNATITVGLPSGGSNDYKVYEFLKNGNPIPVQRGDNPVYIESDLLGGNYVINVYDTNGCLGTTTATIKPFVAIDFATPSAITVTKAVTCINDQDIQVNVTTTGTTTPMPVLSYNVKGTSAGSTYDVKNNDGAFTGLTIGNYLVTVTNTSTGCVLTMIHYVNDPNTFELVASNVNNVVCFGTATGSVDLTIVDNEVSPSNDAGAFDYTITGPVNLTGNSGGVTVNIPNLLAGTYTVKAKLSGKPTCDVETTFLIEQPASALTLKENHTPITCDPGNDGTILAIAEGGWPGDLQYELAGPVNVAYSSQFFFEGLTPGFYTLNVKDVNGCIQTATVTLKNPDPILVTATATVSALICNGDNSGEITVDLPTGGQGSNYSYILNYLSLDPVISSEAQSNPVFSGLAAGTYSVTVVDGLNCISQPSANVVISEPSRVEPSLVLESRVTCKTSATLTLSAIGGTGSYEYSTDAAFTTVLGGFASSTTFAVGLGDHQYYVRDSKGCIGAISNNITVNPITPLSLDLDLSDAKIYCKGSATASIDAIAVGGLGDYIYTLLDNSGGVVRPAQPEGYFDLLPKGTYVVRVDSGDCQYDSAPIVVNEPNEVLSVVPTVTDATCFASNDGKISIAATGGTGVIKYAISPNLGMFDDKFAFDRLAPGFYDIVVQDENSCFEVLKLEIKEPALLGAKVVGPILQEICDGDKDGAFSIEIFGGKPPYSVSLDNENGVYSPVTGTNYDFTGLKGGEHSVYIKDATCISKVDVVMDKAVVLDPTVDINYDCVNNAQTNMVTVTVDKSNTDLTQIDYSLDGTGTYQPGNIFTNVAPGRHFIVARHTNGCKVPTASFDIKAYDPLTLAVSGGKPEMNIISVTAGGGAPAYEYSFNGEPFTSSNRYKIYKSGDYVVVVRDRNGCTATITVPAIYVDVCLDNYFTPAGVTNTTWGPGCTNIYNNLEFSIFDRYGRVIVKYHYGQKWDGRYNGAELPSGDYWYVLKLNDPKDDREFVGHFTLYR